MSFSAHPEVTTVSLLKRIMSPSSIRPIARFSIHVKPIFRSFWIKSCFSEMRLGAEAVSLSLLVDDNEDSVEEGAIQYHARKTVECFRKSVEDGNDDP